MATGVETDVIELLVVGPSGSGKTTFMTTISSHTGFEGGDPNGWYLGHLEVDASLHVHFLEPPVGVSASFIELRQVIEDSVFPGYLVICDSSKPETFGEAIGILQTIYAYHPQVPFALVANQQDQTDAWSSNDMRVGLEIPDDILVLPCNALQFDSVKEVVLQLLYRIYGV